MAWTTPLTAAANTALTAAQWNASVRDNLLTTAPALATAAGQMWVSTAANAGAMRTPTFASVTAAQTTTSIGAYGDLTTVGPAVTVTTGVAAIYGFTATISNGTGLGGGQMAIAITGATTLAADDSRCIYVRHTTGAIATRYGQVQFQPGLTAGSNTLTAKYTTPTGGTATFSDRHLFAIPL
jgi:hypothetical protein